MKNKLFKNIILVVLIFTIIVPSFAFAISATDGTKLTPQEAHKLVADALYLSNYVQIIDAPVVNTKAQKEFEYEYNNKSYKRLYYLVEDETALPGGSMDGLASLAKTVYTEDLANKMTVNARRDGLVDEAYNYPIFMRDEDGKLYAAVMEKYYIDFLYHPVYPYDDFSSDKIVTEIKSFNDKEAVVRVAVSDHLAAEGGAPHDYWAECKLVNTSDGWRIEDCQFTDIVLAQRVDDWSKLEVREIASAPNTADASFEQIVMLTVVATLSLVAVLVVLSRKRRAEA